MTDNTQYYDLLEFISKESVFTRQINYFRLLGNIEALNKIEILIQRYVNEYPKKSELNYFLTPEKYNLQCQSFVTPFLFQPPLFPCKNYEERIVYNDAFKNWSPNEYCSLFYKGLKTSLNVK